MFQTSVVMQQDYSLHILPALSMLDHHDGGNNPNAAILFPQNLPHGSPTKTESCMSALLRRALSSI